MSTEGRGITPMSNGGELDIKLDLDQDRQDINSQGMSHS